MSKPYFCRNTAVIDTVSRIRRSHGKAGSRIGGFCSRQSPWTVFDCVDKNRNSGFLHRLNKENTGYAESIDNFFTHCISEEKLNNLFAEAVRELSHIVRG